MDRGGGVGQLSLLEQTSDASERGHTPKYIPPPSFSLCRKFVPSVRSSGKLIASPSNAPPAAKLLVIAPTAPMKSGLTDRPRDRSNRAEPKTPQTGRGHSIGM